MGPIDIMRTQEASQIKHMESQRAQHLMEQSNLSYKNKVEDQHKKPKETTKSDNNEYRYDAKEKGSSQYSGSKNNKKQKKDEEKKEAKPVKKDGGFNILI